MFSRINLAFSKNNAHLRTFSAKRSFRHWGNVPTTSLTSARFAIKHPIATTTKRFSSTNAPDTPFSWRSLFGVLALGGLGYLYFTQEKKRMLEQRRYTATAGKADIGGPFSLMDLDGKVVTDDDLRGKWTLLYFGFTHCPDVCPEELNKLTEVLEKLDQQSITKGKVHPYFVSIDPNRDTPEVIREYLQDFHPRFKGLTGTEEQVKTIAKQYRIHYSRGPPMADDPNDYIVDHSIISLLFDPNYDYRQFYAINATADQVVLDITKHIRYNPDL